ncbi:pyrroline-5-carboxylate reductase [Flavisolibacter nicotianae]|uniref:pyrroline-5-carboxylate reductase n=1 Tax=Flavisolibacter nicotianae TaxID=2364882 RepID=UPI000EADF920|nr:pyrroline-5-carboxylate reductase [Flavisolibacter nicotianae]
MKATIIGGGNIGMALAEGLLQAGRCKAGDITITKRSAASADSLKARGFSVSFNNAEAVQGADAIFICVLPQQLDIALSQLASSIDLEKQLVVSVVTGAHTQVFRDKLGDRLRIVRAMPNTAMKVRASMTCLSAVNATQDDKNMVQAIFDTVGQCIWIPEDMMSAATALCACGIAFFLRTIRAASQGGVEIGFHAHDALRIASQTAFGAAKLLIENRTHPEEEIDKVTSPKGCTIAGLNEMEHQGLSSAFIKGIKLSSNIANNLYKQE